MECDYGYEFQTPLSTRNACREGKGNLKLVAGPRGRPLIRPKILSFSYTNGLYSRYPGILFALVKGLKIVNCSNYPNFIQKYAVLSKENNSRHLQ